MADRGMIPGQGGGRPKIVILGGGFAGLNAARQFNGHAVDVTVIDRTNHHLFQPLLYQVAMAAVAPSDISAPIRYLLRDQRNTEVILGEVSGIDVEKRIVSVDDNERQFPYDFLIVATGSRHSYFGKDQWSKDAPGLKSLSDALEIRRRFLMAFEEAEKATDAPLRRALLTFVVIGGGPTGCELAGVMPEIAKRALHSDFRRIDTNDTRVILIEASAEILTMYPPKLRDRAKRDLERLGVEIKTNSRVVNVTDSEVTLDTGEVIPTHTVVWAAGNQASPVAKWLGAPLDRAGRVLVEPDLSVPGHPEIFVAGDLAATFNDEKKLNPGVAQTAMQGGTAAGKNILHRLYQEPTRPFRYWDKGNMAVLGRGKAIAEIFVPGAHGKSLKMTGFIAWCAWLFLHILYLVGFRNRLSVLVQWAYSYLTFQRGVRLISDTDKAHIHRGQEQPKPEAPALAQPTSSPETPQVSTKKVPVGTRSFEWDGRR